MRRLPLVLLGLASLLLGAAAVYRWVDDEGRTHYSDIPPRGASPAVEPAKPPPAPAADDASRGASGPAATLDATRSYILYTGTDAPRFRLALAVRVAGVEDAQLEAEFDNPAEPGSTLRGTRVGRGVAEGELVIVSEEFSSIQCRAYAVTVRLYGGAERDAPLATKRETIRSHFDSAAIAAGGEDAKRRLDQDQPVCQE